mmetsp:Transcript_31433/g.53057  ORF Transcript_31433/g.53057 Transcript_31433/m.53057 type:complete len:206 (-) Transcript_31433:452-1069(-)
MCLQCGKYSQHALVLIITINHSTFDHVHLYENLANIGSKKTWTPLEQSLKGTPLTTFTVDFKDIHESSGVLISVDKVTDGANCEILRSATPDQLKLASVSTQTGLLKGHPWHKLFWAKLYSAVKRMNIMMLGCQGFLEIPIFANTDCVGQPLCISCGRVIPTHQPLAIRSFRWFNKSYVFTRSFRKRSENNFAERLEPFNDCRIF